MAKSLNTVSTASHAAQSVMARILATENIRVVIDPRANTAAFDLKNRALILPQWKDMSKSVYDMLIGHEISHALHTPAEGWRDVCNKISGTTDHTSQAWQTASLYLNVVEDARIERLIQIKFPGFRRDFIAAYNELNDKNFFGVKGQNMNALTLPDRINLYYKLGTIGSVGISFNTAEDAFIRRIDNAATFADAAQIAEDLFKFCKEQQHKQQQQNQPQSGGNQQQGDQGNNGPQSQDQNADQGGDQGGDQGDAEDKGGDQGGDSSRPGSDDGHDDGKSSPKQPADSKQQGQVGGGHSPSANPPAPMTQQKFNDALKQQVAQDKFSSRLEVPTNLVGCDLTKVLIDCKICVEQARKDLPWLFNPSDAPVMRGSGARTEREAVRYYTDKQDKFMQNSKKQIDLLRKQFELRKAAQIAKRESVRKTGILDSVRMVNYKHSEDIFRRNTMLPEGKNHGLVMFVDWSGSMGICLEPVVEQMMVLVEFCRRMQIPYEVFAFTTRNFMSGNDPRDCNSTPARRKVWNGEVGDSYDSDSNEQIMAAGSKRPRVHAEFSLMNIMSSRLSRTEHRDMMLFLRALINRQIECYTAYMLPTQRWDLSGTALDESIVAAMQIVPEFKQSNKLDIVNTIFLTDGETSVPYCQQQLIDPKTKAVYSGDSMAGSGRDARSTDILLLAFRDITKSNAIGMFLTHSGSHIYPESYFRNELKREEAAEMARAGAGAKDSWAQSKTRQVARKTVIDRITKKFNEDNCIVAESGTTGYSEFFFIKSSARVVEEFDPMQEVERGATQAAVKKAFLKSFEGKNKSRVLINQFIELIAR